MTTFRREACNTLRSMTASLKVQETLHKMSGREVAHLVVLALPSSTAAISQTPRPALLPDAWHRPLFHFPHYEPERSAAPTYTHDLEQMHPKAHARDDRGSMLSNDKPQSSPGGGSTDGLSAQPTAPFPDRKRSAVHWPSHRAPLLIAACCDGHRTAVHKNEENSKEFPTGHFTISRKVIVHLPHSAAGTRGKAFPFPRGTASERHRTAREPWNLPRCCGGGTASREAPHSPSGTVSPLWGERADMPTSRLFAFSPSKTPFYSS